MANQPDKSEEAQARFLAQGSDMEVVLIPQCCRCDHNIDLATCTEFSPKPEEYPTNAEPCPVFKPW